MARIVIAGGGFAGIEAARVIARGIKLRGLKEKHKITIIDKNDYHTFTPALIPASTTPKTVTDEMVHSAVCIPFSDIHFSIPVEIIIDEIVQFNVAWNSVVGKRKHYEYDYLIIAIGQEPTFYNLQGMKKHSFTLTTIEHALAIRNELARQVEINDTNEAHIRVIGGGPTGVEFAGLLRSRRYSIVQAVKGRCELFVSLLDKNSTILNKYKKKVRKRVIKFLEAMDVSIVCDAKISKVTDQYIEFENQEKMKFDMIFWGAGRAIGTTGETLPFSKEHAGTIVINNSGIPKIPGAETLGRPVYVAGDVSFIENTVMWTAPNAMTGGKNVGEHILANIDFAERLPSDFVAPKFKAKNDSIFLLGRHIGVITSFMFVPASIGILIRRLVDLRYFLRIMRPINAWKQWKRMKILYI